MVKSQNIHLLTPGKFLRVRHPTRAPELAFRQVQKSSVAVAEDHEHLADRFGGGSMLG